ncbi:MAG: hypothetical protein HYV19_03965 [Gemmatimonadetes bacterium]|nr:hypothetical protein [Gemmatimonadota bacterium]
MTARYAPLLFIVAAAAAACGDSTGPSRSATSLSFSAHAPATSQMAGTLALNGQMTVGSGGDTLVITKAQVVLKQIELKQAAGVSCPDSASKDDGCEELKLGPVLVDLPLSSNVTAPVTVSVPSGTYREIELEVHRVGGDALDAAFTAAHPDFSDISIRLEGTFNGAPFVYTSKLDAELEMALEPPVVIDGAGGNITVQIDISNWFRNGSTVIDPRTANVGGVNEGIVKEQIKRSFHAVEDHDRDGK